MRNAKKGGLDMIDYNDLINRIESMQDLPVSEEMLGAYCEGSLNPIDAAAMDSCIANEAMVDELVASADNSQVSDNLYTFGYGTDGVDDIDLPNVPMSSAINPFDIAPFFNIDDIGMIAVAAPPVFSDIADDFVSRSDEFISDNDDSFLSDDDSIHTEDDINGDDSFDDFNPDEL